jgi:predicted nucleotidyltransferase
MTRNEVLQILLRFQYSTQDEYKIRRIGIFGSVARNQFTDASDIDVVVELAEPDLLTLVGIKQDLERLFHRPVDVVRYRSRMSPFLKHRIEQEAIYV